MLIFQALGLHVHGDATGPVVVDDHVWMMLLFTGTLYAFYLMEIGMCLLSGNGGHGHSHGLGHTNEQKVGNFVILALFLLYQLRARR